MVSLSISRDRGGVSVSIPRSIDRSSRTPSGRTPVNVTNVTAYSAVSFYERLFIIANARIARSDLSATICPV